MKEKPHYMSVPTLRNYEAYRDAENYTKGWNDAMDYIFPEAKEKRKKESAKKKLKLLEAESENKQSSHFEGNLVDGVPSEKSERYNNF